MIHIWSLDGRVVQGGSGLNRTIRQSGLSSATQEADFTVLNRSQSSDLRNGHGTYNDPTAPDSSYGPSLARRRPHTDIYGTGSSHCVRDVSWHGYEPTLMSTCWEIDGGYRRGGTLAKHEWKGFGKGGMRNLEDWVEKTKAEMEE